MSFVDKLAEALKEKFPKIHEWDGDWGVTEGRKYDRIVHGSGVYCFVDHEGNVYKAASWAAPAKHVRANIATEEGFRAAVEKADQFGSWLYWVR